jgi:hypothetical protein
MLSQIQIEVFNNSFWFKAADIARILTLRTDVLTSKKQVTSQLLTNCKYIDESSFRLLFASNISIIAELEEYKQALDVESYSNLLTIAYCYICLDGSSHYLKTSQLQPLAKKGILGLVQCEDVALAFLEVYLNARFLQVTSTINPQGKEDLILEAPDYCLLDLLHDYYPVKILSSTLHDIYQSKKPTSLFKELLLKAIVKTDKAALMQELKRHFLPNEVSMMAQRVVTGDQNKKLVCSHYHYPIGYNRVPYYVLEAAHKPLEAPISIAEYSGNRKLQVITGQASDPNHTLESGSGV